MHRFDTVLDRLHHALGSVKRDPTLSKDRRLELFDIMLRSLPHNIITFKTQVTRVESNTARITALYKQQAKELEAARLCIRTQARDLEAMKDDLAKMTLRKNEHGAHWASLKRIKTQMETILALVEALQAQV